MCMSQIGRVPDDRGRMPPGPFAREELRSGGAPGGPLRWPRTILLEDTQCCGS
jgi:hypothetical protein